MAEKIFKVNEAIEIVYQAPNKESGLSGGSAPVAEIYLPSNAKDSGFPDVVLEEIGAEGIYHGSFAPDSQGEWKAIIHKSDGDGQVVKRYSVGAHNVSSVGEAVGVTDGKVDTLDGKADDAATQAITDAGAAANAAVATDALVTNLDGDVVALDTKVDDVKTTADSIETKVDNLDTKVSSLDTPPMVS